MQHWLKKWTTWEYLPWWLANIPVYFFWLWFAFRARNLVFFSNVNPAIPMGGAFGESKWDILKLLPPDFVPKTIFIPAGTPMGAVLSRMSEAALEFPVVAKPDVGERGFLIRTAADEAALEAHLAQFPADFLVQEFLTLPLELTVSFHRFPDGRFDITSVCIKEFMGVVGDGESTVEVLMGRDTRSALQLERFRRDQPGLMARVPGAGERLLLEPIGNHARGTKFLNGKHLIDAGMKGIFQKICERLEGVLFGRFDLKSASVEALKRGEFLIMELNGVLGEPAHVYDPAYGMWRAYRDLYRHWRILFRLYREQKFRGIDPMPGNEAFAMARNYFRYKKELESRNFAKNLISNDD